MHRSIPTPAVDKALDDEVKTALLLDPNLKELFLCVRKGNLERVKYLVEECDVPINVRDEWDSTPLYYACLCGHLLVVRFLLAHGARCEANTFDGERCLYGALNDHIRNLLREYKLQTLIKRDRLREFLRKLHQSNTFSDFTFVIKAHKFKVHRCVLCARSSFLYRMLNTEWRTRKEVSIRNKLIQTEAFNEFVTYLYTGILELPAHLVDAFMVVCKEFGEKRLAARVKFEAKRGAVAIEMGVEKLQVDLHFLYRSAVPREVLALSDGNKLDMELDALPFAFAHVNDWAESADTDTDTDTNTNTECGGDESLAFPDLCFELCMDDSNRGKDENANKAGAGAGSLVHSPPTNSRGEPQECTSGRNCRFFVHKCFFFERSEYFRALLTNQLGPLKRTIRIAPSLRSSAFKTSSESQPTTQKDEQALLEVDCVSLDMPLHVFREVVRFVYTQTAVLSRTNVWQILETAEMLLLTDLKRICAVFLEANELDVDTCIDLLGISRMFSLPRLENSAVHFIASHLDELICTCVLQCDGANRKTHEMESEVKTCEDPRHARCKALCTLVISDASAVRERQETDTVIIVDEMRYHVNASELYPAEKNAQLALISKLLDHLGVSA